MDIRVLQYFLAVAREESITKAAKALRMTQQPLSRQLKDLEEELGKQLFIRGSKKVTLTEDGMLLRKRAEELVDLMEKTKAELTISSEDIGGDIYIGVVGPVRSGKSTFITNFMNTFVIPSASGYELERMRDELPQSAEGKAVMTTQPKFVPAEAVTVALNDTAKISVRLVDCVGYMADGATGHKDGDGARMVKTPWSDTPIPFERAAEIGTRKVIADHSTIGVVMTSDGL